MVRTKPTVHIFDFLQRDSHIFILKYRRTSPGEALYIAKSFSQATIGTFGDLERKVNFFVQKGKTWGRSK